MEERITESDSDDENSHRIEKINRENTSKNTVNLSELRNDECVSDADVSIPLTSVDETLIEVSSTSALLDSLIVAIPFQNKLGHYLETNDIEYEWKPPHCDTCKIFDHTDEHCPKKTKTTTPIHVTDDGFVEVQDDMFETNNSAWRKNNNIESIVSDSDSEEVENVLREDNGKHMDGLVDDARKKVEAPPKKTPRKTRIWLGRKADSPKRNVAFFPERRFTTLIGRIMKNWSIKMPIAKRVDDSRMVIGIFTKKKESEEENKNADVKEKKEDKKKKESEKEDENIDVKEKKKKKKKDKKKKESDEEDVNTDAKEKKKKDNKESNEEDDNANGKEKKIRTKRRQK
ncbi:hypothetical protein Tco_0578999 [Tanacetum coccineum]